MLRTVPGLWTERRCGRASAGRASTRARSWRLSDIAEYLQAGALPEELAAETAAYPWFTRLDPSLCAVPPGFGSAIEAETDGPATDAERGAASKAPDLTLEGMDLLSAFTRVLNSAARMASTCAGGGERDAVAASDSATRWNDSLGGREHRVAAGRRVAGRAAGPDGRD